MVPQADAELVRTWAATIVPEHVRDQVRIEVDESDRSLTVFECRPPWEDSDESEWFRIPVARLTYVKKRNEWTLYWSDRNDKFHRYDLLDPSEHVTVLLAEIDDDPTALFWG